MCEFSASKKRVYNPNIDFYSHRNTLTFTIVNISYGFVIILMIINRQNISDGIFDVECCDGQIYTSTLIWHRPNNLFELRKNILIGRIFLAKLKSIPKCRIIYELRRCIVPIWTQSILALTVDIFYYICPGTLNKYWL